MQEDSNLKVHPSVMHFVAVARAFCRLVETDVTEPILETGATEPNSWMIQILSAVSDLYAAAHYLPAAELEPTNIDPEDRFDLTKAEYRAVFLRMGQILGEARYYPDCSSSLDPLADPEPPGIGDLADDLADIYRDIKPGLRALDHNRDEYVSMVVFGWKEPLFKTHWGRHAVDAMRVLHILIYG